MKKYLLPFLVVVLFLTLGAAIRQLIGPSVTTDNAVVVWDGTTAYKTKNSGVLVTSPATIAFSRSQPTTIDLGTVAGGGTATLANSNSQYRVTFSGATATIALPASPNDGTFIVHAKTTYNGGTQIITVPSLIRPELDFDTAVTTFTNAASTGGEVTISFTAYNGSFLKFSVVGDSL
jgi:hypothetical protein